MPYGNYYRSFEDITETLHMLKFFHDIGIYENVIRGVNMFNGDDYYEFLQLGVESIAPYYDERQIYMDENGNWVDEDDIVEGAEIYSDCPNTIYHFSSPDMQEYYSLCRLYEYRHSIKPEENPFVQEADRYYCTCVNSCYGSFAACFDDEIYTKHLLIELASEGSYFTLEMLIAIYNMLGYYKEHVNKLRLELMKWPPVFLPALPAAKEGCETNG